MDPVHRITVFTTVVEQKSFSNAARMLNITKSAVSKHIQALEDQLGARLINRTTRSLSLTEAGATYYQYCLTILEQLREAEGKIRNLNEKPRGKLRINAPVTFGILHLAPVVTEFAQLYPDISIELEMSDRFLNIVEEGFDVAVRISPMEDSSLIARKLTPICMHMFASPEYLKKFGRPKTIEELQKHKFIEYSYRNPRGEWHYQDAKKSGRIRFEEHFLANNGETLRQAALKGLGITLLPTFIVWKDVKEGTLVPVLPELEMEPGRMLYVMYPHNRHVSTKVRVFVDFLVKHFGKSPVWDICKHHKTAQAA